MDMVLAAVRECLFCFKNIIMDHPCEHLLRMQPCTWMVLLLLVNYFSPPERRFLLVPDCCGCQGQCSGQGEQGSTAKGRFASQQDMPKKYWFQLRGSTQAKHAGKLCRACMILESAFAMFLKHHQSFWGDILSLAFNFTLQRCSTSAVSTNNQRNQNHLAKEQTK